MASQQQQLRQARTMYDQAPFYRQMQLYKREALNQFWSDYVTYTGRASLAALFLVPVFTGSRFIKAPLSCPIVPLVLGVAGGIALSQCAGRFNELQRIEMKIRQPASSADSKQFEKRLDLLQGAIAESRRQYLANPNEPWYSCYVPAATKQSNDQNSASVSK